MRKVFFVVLGVVSVLLAICIIPTLVCKACGLAGMKDCSDGSRWESGLVLLLCAALISGLSYLSYRMFRLFTRR
jgi:hypothetical protein